MNKQTQKELLNIVKKNYSEIAEHYSETRKKVVSAKFKDIFEAIKPGSQVLDVGCGSGRILNELKEKGIKYLGVDNCENFITMLEKTKQKGSDNKFIKGDLLELGELKEYNFDYVFAIAVLQHIPGRDLQIIALRQLKNKVKENGQIVITVWNMWSPAWKKKKFKTLILKFFLLKIIGKNRMDFGDVLFDWKNSKGDSVIQRYYHAFRKCELKKISKKAGLKIEKIYKDKYNYYLILKK